MQQQIDYAKYLNYAHRHHKRYKQYVESHGLPCQECGSGGGEIVPVLDYGQGPFEECGWCEGTGLVTRWLRGLWLSYKRAEKSRGQHGSNQD